MMEASSDMWEGCRGVKGLKSYVFFWSGRVFEMAVQGTVLVYVFPQCSHETRFQHISGLS